MTETSQCEALGSSTTPKLMSETDTKTPDSWVRDAGVQKSPNSKQPEHYVFISSPCPQVPQG